MFGPTSHLWKVTATQPDRAQAPKKGGVANLYDALGRESLWRRLYNVFILACERETHLMHNPFYTLEPWGPQWDFPLQWTTIVWVIGVILRREGIARELDLQPTEQTMRKCQ